MQKTIDTISLELTNEKISYSKNLQQTIQTYQQTMQDAIEDNKILQDEKDISINLLEQEIQTLSNQNSSLQKDIAHNQIRNN